MATLKGLLTNLMRTDTTPPFLPRTTCYLLLCQAMAMTLKLLLDQLEVGASAKGPGDTIAT